MNESSILERRFPGRRAILKREILEGALASFNEFGIEMTTIETIKARCETSVGAIYHHFGNKEGLLSALFFTAMDDQHDYFRHHIEKANTLEEVVSSIVISYLDWVVEHPEWARFQYQARTSVAKGPYHQELAERNSQQFQALREKFLQVESQCSDILQPFELLPSLIVGASENYCRAWLSGRVRTPPSEFRSQLADAAWRSVQK